MMKRVSRVALVMALTVVTAGRVSPVAAQPAPPYPPPPPPRVYAPPSPRYYPLPPAVAPPPPLSPLMRVVYAPFYGAGLVVRYGVYYAFVAPLEVFSRALTYGAEGGVDEQREGDSR